MHDIKIQERASGKEKDALALQGKAAVGLCNWAISARMATAAYSSTQNALPGENEWRFQVHNKDVFISVWTQRLPDPVKICSLPSMQMQSTLWLSVYLPSLDPVSARLILHFTLWSKWGANFLVEDYLKFKFKLTFLIYCNLVCLFPADNRYSVSLQKCNDQSFTGTWSLSLTSLTCSET